MCLCQPLLVDRRLQANQNLSQCLTVTRQVLAKTCRRPHLSLHQSVQVRRSPKARLRLCRQVSQQFHHRPVKMVPRLQVHRRVPLRP